jgi:hypothetical protein
LGGVTTAPEPPLIQGPAQFERRPLHLAREHSG